MKIAQDTATSQETSIMPERVLRDLVVERWLVSRLIPYIRNARTHSEEQVAQVAASIVEFGWTNPILAGADGVIIAGHARLLAARKLGMTEVPVIVLDHLSEAQRRALVLADNRLAMNAGWDEAMLRVELESLREDSFDLDIVGFTAEEMENLLREPEEATAGNADEDAVPETQETAVTVPGDVWLLGPHRALVTSASERSQAGRRWPWWIVSAAVIALELSSYLELPRAAHPTLSSLYVTASGHRAVKAVIFLAWMALGWLIAGYRPHRVDAVVGHDRA